MSGDVFSLRSLPYTSLPPRAAAAADEDDARGRPHLPKLRGLMAARALLTNPALFAGYDACPWEAVEVFLNKVVRAPLPLKLVQHHCEYSQLGEGFLGVIPSRRFLKIVIFSLLLT